MSREQIEYVKSLQDKLEEYAAKKYYAIQWRQKYQRLTEPQGTRFDNMQYIQECMVRLQELENMIADNTLIYNKPKIWFLTKKVV